MILQTLWHWTSSHAAPVIAIGASVIVQSTVLLGAGLLAAALLRRRSAIVQSAVLRAALVAALICPAASYLLGIAGANGWRIALPGIGVLSTSSGLAAVIAAVAIVVSGLLLTRLVVAIRRVRRVRRESRSASLEWITDSGRCARVIGVNAPPVLQTDRFQTPCVVGWQQPAILLPVGSTEVRHDVLLHELAHLRRRDCFWHLLALIARALLWFQPLIWILTRRLSRSADEACDDVVLAYGSDRAEYARALVDMAQRYQTPWMGTGCAVGMTVFKSAVARRVVRIMDNTRKISIDGRRVTTAAILLLGAAATLFAALLTTTTGAADGVIPPLLPAPDAATQAKTEKVVRDVFGNYTAGNVNERDATANKMIDQALATQDDPAARFVLLKDAADLAAGVGDARTAMRAADLLGAGYVIDAGEMKYALLHKAAAVSSVPAVAQMVAAEGLTCADQAVALGNFDLANRFMQPTEQAARNAKNVTLLLNVQARAAEIKWMQQEEARSKTAAEKLAKNPNDPDANLSHGRYLCLVRGDWKQGLPSLAKGTNRALHAAATADLGNPITTDKQVAAGDLWWDAAEHEQAAAQKALRRRAGYWYSLAMANPQFAGLSRARVEKRLSQVPPPGPGEMVAEVPPAVAPPPVTPTPDVPRRIATDTGPNILSSMVLRGNCKRMADGSVVMLGGILETPRNYTVPFRADFIAKTDSTNIRIHFAKGELIFNWEGHQDIAPLCFSDPAKGGDRVLRFNNKGHVPVNEFVQLTWIIEDNSTRILVNGEERERIDGAYAGLSAPLQIFPQAGSVVTVKSVSVSAAGSTPTASPPAPANTPPAGAALNPPNPVPASPIDIQRMDGTWRNTRLSERYILSDDHTGGIMNLNGEIWTKFNWTLEKNTLTFVSVNKNWTLVIDFDMGLGKPGKGTWTANGMTMDRGTIAREAQLMADAAGMEGQWKNTRTSGNGKNERYVLNNDLTGAILFPNGEVWTRFTWTLVGNTLTFVSLKDDWRLVTTFDQGVGRPGKAIWTANGNTEDRGTIIRDGPAGAAVPAPPVPGPAAVAEPKPPAVQQPVPSTGTRVTLIVVNDDDKCGVEVFVNGKPSGAKGEKFSHWGRAFPLTLGVSDTLAFKTSDKATGAVMFFLVDANGALLTYSRAGTPIHGEDAGRDDFLVGKGGIPGVIVANHKPEKVKQAMTYPRTPRELPTDLDPIWFTNVRQSPIYVRVLPAQLAPGTFPGTSVAKKNILIFVGTAREEALFRAIPGANVRVVKSAESAGVLALPDAIGGANVIVWGRNTFADLADDALTPAEWDSMLRQMQGGGDVVIFEQSGGNAERTAHIKGHWQFIEKNFGVGIHGGPIIGALAGNRDLAARFQAAGISQEILKVFVFGKGFMSLPAGAEVLVMGGPAYDIPVVVGIPVGKGRLILLGASLDRSERDPAFAAALFGYIYGPRGAGEATAPLEGAAPAPPAGKPKSGPLFEDADAPPKK